METCAHQIATAHLLLVSTVPALNAQMLQIQLSSVLAQLARLIHHAPPKPVMIARVFHALLHQVSTVMEWSANRVHNVLLVSVVTAYVLLPWQQWNHPPYKDGLFF